MNWTETLPDVIVGLELILKSPWPTEEDRGKYEEMLSVSRFELILVELGVVTWIE